MDTSAAVLLCAIMAENGFTTSDSGNEKLLDSNGGEKKQDAKNLGESVIEVVEPAKGSWGRAW